MSDENRAPGPSLPPPVPAPAAPGNGKAGRWLPALPLWKRAVLGSGALVVSLAAWLPCVNLLYSESGEALLRRDGLSPWARRLAARHLAMSEDPDLRAAELRRMRAHNAEWDFMGRSFLVWALGNVAFREPAMEARCLEVMDRIIDDTLELEREKGMYHFLMSYARARPFISDPPRSIFLDGEIALMLAHRRMVEERADHAEAMRERVRAMAAAMRAGPVLCAESYPDECWLFCNAVALAAIRIGDRLDGTDHSALFRDWVASARRKLTDGETGILLSSFSVGGQVCDGPEGSTIWLAAHCLDLIDEGFARGQYERARRELGRVFLGFGYAREWPESWVGPQDVDSGPTVPFFEANAGASGLAFVGAAAFADADYFSALRASVDFAGFPLERGGGLRYCASNQVGDAVMLYAAVLGPVWERVRCGGR